MQIPASTHFTPIDLSRHFNIDRAALEQPLRPPADITQRFGDSTFLGIPFQLGATHQPNAIPLDQEPITIDVENVKATYVIFAHVVADRVSVYQEGLADFAVDGNELGDHVADYTLSYADGEEANTAILRRFAIQQSRIL